MLGVFCVFDDVATNLGPVYTLVQVLVHEADAYDIVASDEVKAVLYLAALFWIIWRSYDALDGIFEDKIGDLIA